MRSSPLYIAATLTFISAPAALGHAAEPLAPEVPLEERIAAAAATAQSSPDCSTAVLGPYYWQIGDRSAKLAYGTIGAGAPGGSTQMSIASASKWVYSTYVIQKVGSRTGDIPFLNFTSGYN